MAVLLAGVKLVEQAEVLSKLGLCWSLTVEILLVEKGLILADVSKGECCPFIVNVNVKENRREAFLLVRVRQRNHNK